MKVDVVEVKTLVQVAEKKGKTSCVALRTVEMKVHGAPDWIPDEGRFEGKTMRLLGMKVTYGTEQTTFEVHVKQVRKNGTLYDRTITIPEIPKVWYGPITTVIDSYRPQADFIKTLDEAWKAAHDE